MKSLKRIFKEISKQNPYWSSYICFSETVKDEHLNFRYMNYWFTKLVDKDDYLEEEKIDVVKFLVSRSLNRGA